MMRHLNGVKYPLSEGDLLDIVSRVEEKFVKHILVPAAAPIVVTVVAQVAAFAASVHDEDCRCDACVRAYLEAMEKRSSEHLEEVKKVLEQSQEINYVD